MRVLLDTNIVLDLLLDRQPWSSLVGLDRARTIIVLCTENFRIAAVDEAVLRDAISLAGKDFEDDVQIAAARSAGLDGVLTRDPKGFASSPVAVWDPQAFHAVLLARLQGRPQP